MITCVGLQNPNGTIQVAGISAGGSVSEVDIIPFQSVPANGMHFIGDIKVAVKKGAAGTIFRLYRLGAGESGVGRVVDTVEIGDYGTYTSTYAVGRKFLPGEQWKVTLQQDTAARCSVNVGGISSTADLRT